MDFNPTTLALNQHLRQFCPNEKDPASPRQRMAARLGLAKRSERGTAGDARDNRKDVSKRT
jgi:hypothetical protein